MKSNSSPTPESIHPSLWRASQLARGVGDYLACGYPALAAELPGAGWPGGALTEILIQHQGTAELRLLQPALANLTGGQIIFLQAPYQPQALALAELGMDLSRLLWLRCSKHADALWAAEQILRSGSCAALLFWPNQIKTENLRRLHLAAQSGNTLFAVIRPLQQAFNPSPAPLRLKLKSSAVGLQVEIIKRRGAPGHTPLTIPLARLSSMYSANPEITTYDYAARPLSEDSEAHDSSPAGKTSTGKPVAGRTSASTSYRSISAELAGG
jgi:protein ImuA